jgi:hypothetical protein
MIADDSVLFQLKISAEDWARGMDAHLRQAIVSAQVIEGGDGRDSIHHFVDQFKDGNMRIKFRMNRYLLMVEKGAGKGYGGKKGSEWRNKRGQLVKTNPNSLGKMGTGLRPAREWVKPALKGEINRLRKLVAEHYRVSARNALL